MTKRHRNDGNIFTHLSRKPKQMTDEERTEWLAEKAARNDAASELEKLEAAKSRRFHEMMHREPARFLEMCRQRFRQQYLGESED